MRDYYLHATNIYTFSQNLFEHCRQSKRSLKKVISSLTKKAIGNGFHISDSSLIYEGDAKEDFKKDKLLLLTALELCKQHQVLPDFKLRRQMRLSKNLVSAQFANTEEVRSFLFSVLKNKTAEKILRLMHETNILGQILPEFGLSHCKLTTTFIITIPPTSILCELSDSLMNWLLPASPILPTCQRCIRTTLTKEF